MMQSSFHHDRFSRPAYLSFAVYDIIVYCIQSSNKSQSQTGFRKPIRSDEWSIFSKSQVHISLRGAD
jgi:hypothetical protein